MVIEVAGVTAEVLCRYAENARMFQDYTTDKPPELTIAPTDADIHNMRAILDDLAEKQGEPLQRYSDSELESNVVYCTLCEALIDHDVLPMHGSALCMDGAAYIFAAKSGTGKSTHSRLWREVYGDRVWMINDDKPVVKVTDGRAAVYGTPWTGKHRLGCNASAPLKAIVRLSRDDENHIERLSDADAFQMLMERSYFSRDPARMARIVALVNRLVHAAEFYSLGCNMSPEAAVVAHDGMNAGKI